MTTYYTIDNYNMTSTFLEECYYYRAGKLSEVIRYGQENWELNALVNIWRWDEEFDGKLNGCCCYSGLLANL